MDEPIIAAELADGPEAATALEPKKPWLQLSLATLLLWVTGTAVVLAAERSYVYVVTMLGIMRFPADGGFIEGYSLVSRLIVSPVFAIAIVFSARAVWGRMVRGERHAKEPGHWVLHQFAAWILTSALAVSIIAWFSPYEANLTAQEADFRQTIQSWAIAAPALASGFVSAWACFGMAGRLSWRFYFGAYAAGAALLFLLACLRLLPGASRDAMEDSGVATSIVMLGFLGQFVLFLVSTVACLVAMLSDLASPRPLDRLHWTGVGMLLVYVVLILADSTASSFDRYVY